jgi:hypothetical protein
MAETDFATTLGAGELYLEMTSFGVSLLATVVAFTTVSSSSPADVAQR